MSDSAVQGGLAGLTAPRILQLKVGRVFLLSSPSLSLLFLPLLPPPRH